MNSMNRRHFLKHMATGMAATSAGMTFANNVLAAAPALKSKGKHLIVLWMGGGPTHMDLWDIKVGSANQGSFQPIKTASKDVEISEVMPTVAKQFDKLSVIRTLNSKEGDHGRGTYRMTHGFAPSPIGVQIPGIGSVLSFYSGSDDIPMPRVVSVGGGQIGEAGFLGATCAAFPCDNPGTVPPNMSMNVGGNTNPQETLARGMRRQGLLNVLENNFKFGLTPHISSEKDRKGLQDAAQAHAELYSKAFEVSMKTGPAAFTFGPKETPLLEKFGNNGFGRGALLASKLVQNGVTAVQINLGGWDMHNQIEAGVKRNAATLDPAMGSLTSHLADIGLLKDTVIVWMGDFGRTPRINQNAGRDHWSNGWSVVLGGGALKGGVSYGEMDADGVRIKDKPVTVEQMYATIYTALGIDLKDRNLDLHDNLGRRFYISGEKENAAPIADLL
jgi:uncharacterized protein (DUF1501 family)